MTNGKSSTAPITKPNNIHIPTSASTAPSAPYLSLGIKLAYSLPTFLLSLYSTFERSHLTKFYIEDLCHAKNSTCLSGVQYGLITSLIGSLGLFIDLFISYFVDFLYSKYKSHLPLIAVGAPIIAISEIALFTPPRIILDAEYNNGSSFWLGIWFLFFTLLKNFVPLSLSYNALGPTLTKHLNQQQRDELFAAKHMLGLIGGLIGGFVPSLVSVFVQRTLPKEHAEYIIHGSYTFYAVLDETLIVLSYWYLCFVIHRYFTESNAEAPKSESPTDAKKNDSLPLIVGIKLSFKNQAFLSLLCLFMFESARGLIWNGLYTLYMIHVLELKDSTTYDLWTGIFNTAGTLTALAVTPIWVRISKKLGNYKTWLLSYLIQVPVGLLVYLFVNKYEDVYIYFVFVLILSFAGRATGFLLDSIKANVVDYDEFYTGQRRESTLEAVWGLIPRYISLPGSTLSFALLQHFAGYEHKKQSSQTAPPAGSVSVKHMVNIQAALLPSLTAVICLILMLRFPISDSRHYRIKQGIKEHRQGKQALDPVTKKLVAAPKETLENQKKMTMHHFFYLELKALYQSIKNRAGGYKSLFRKHLVNIQRLFAAVWFLVSACFFGLFIFGTITIHYYSQESAGYFAVGYNTLYLWLSSIFFTASMFHYLRITPAKEMVKLSAQDFEQFFTEEYAAPQKQE